MSQSDERVPGRGRGGPPPSFGRSTGQQPAEDFTIRGGQSFHLVLHVEVQPDAASLEALHAAVREVTRAGVLDGYAAAFTDMDSDEPAAGGGPPAEPVSEGGGGGG